MAIYGVTDEEPATIECEPFDLDVNNDNLVDDTDLEIFEKCIYKEEGCRLENFDFNCDGMITIVGDVPPYLREYKEEVSEDVSTCNPPKPDLNNDMEVIEKDLLFFEESGP